MDYSLFFVNNSTQFGNACVYQQQPSTSTNPNVMSLAWFSQGAAPTTTLQFEWSDDYSFVWSQTGVLQAGVQFAASQTWPADLSSTNQVQLTDINGMYTFQNQGPGPQQGSLYILQDSSIPPSQASVGIGMSGSGTFVLQAQPNMTNIFTPTPEYWITFGNYTQGAVLDIESITSAALVSFPPNVYSMTATLSSLNLWTVQPTSAVNAAFVEAQKNDKKARWGAIAA